MSVASQFPPEVYIPAAARPRSLRALPAAPDVPSYVIGPAAPAAAALGAEVVDLDRWRPQCVGAQVGGRRRNDADLRTRLETSARGAAPIRLTRRGIAVVTVLSAAIAVAFVIVAWLSAAHRPASVQPRSGGVGSVVTVHSGDSLWSIAAAVAPNRDPRIEVAQLQSINHLVGDVVSPGQQLRLR